MKRARDIRKKGDDVGYDDRRGRNPSTVRLYWYPEFLARVFRVPFER